MNGDILIISVIAGCATVIFLCLWLMYREGSEE